jgi:hypothetical protein
MKTALAAHFISSLALAAKTIQGAVCSESMEFVLDDSAMKLLFDGFKPTVNRYVLAMLDEENPGLFRYLI